MEDLDGAPYYSWQRGIEQEQAAAAILTEEY